MKHTGFDWTDEEIATLEIPRTCSVNQKETREERNSNRRNACNITPAKRIGTITYMQNCL